MAQDNNQRSDFLVEISQPGSPSGEVDSAWESCQGGELIIETTEVTVGGDGKNRHSVRKSVGEITLRGAMTDKRAALIAWINDTLSGKSWNRTLTITELLEGKPGRVQIYYDCFPVGYVFPKLPANGGADLIEEVRIKPNRVELR